LHASGSQGIWHKRQRLTDKLANGHTDRDEKHKEAEAGVSAVVVDLTCYTQQN
jgi:hypothetical protein